MKYRLLSAMIAAAIIAGLFYTIDPHQVWDALLQSDYRFLPAILGLRWLTLLPRCPRLAVLFERPARDLAVIYHAESSCLFFNALLPLRAGEIAEVALLRTILKLPGSRILTGLTLDRLFDILFLSLFMLLVLPWLPGLSGRIAHGLMIAGVISGVVFLAMGCALWRHHSLHRWAGRLLERFLPASADLWLSRLNEGIAGIRLLGSPLRLTMATVCTAALWGLAVLSLQVVAWSFGQAPDWMASILAVGLTVLGMAVVGTPNGIGVMHAAITVAYVLFGIPEATALAIAVIFHAATVVVSLLSGGLSVYIYRDYFRSISGRLRGRERGLDISEVD